MRLTDGNSITLLRSGAEYFPALCKALLQANREVFLETYIFRADKTGRLIADALIEIAQRGVPVHVLADGFGSSDFPQDWENQLRSAGVRFLFFRPEVSRFSLSRQRLRRLHRKLVTIDGRIGFAGGINILDDDVPGMSPRYDYALQLEGPLVLTIRMHMAQQWWRSYNLRLSLDRVKLPKTPPPLLHAGGLGATLVVRDNLRHRRDIERAYMLMMATAKHDIILANAYFLPGKTLRTALVNAARRGVRVRLLLQGRVDHALIFHASRVLYPELLLAGVEIHEYVAGLMHAKVAVFDDEWLTVGSSNIDPFSLLTAREANIVVKNNDLATQLRADIESRLEQDSIHITVEHSEHLSGWKRLLAWLSYQAIRLLLGISGYGGGDYRN